MRLENITILNEVFLEVYNLFVQAWEEGTDQPKEQQIKDAFYWYVSDYSDLLLPSLHLPAQWCSQYQHYRKGVLCNICP